MVGNSHQAVYMLHCHMTSPIRISHITKTPTHAITEPIIIQVNLCSYILQTPIPTKINRPLSSSPPAQKRMDVRDQR
jgi:hypothetical protein